MRLFDSGDDAFSLGTSEEAHLMKKFHDYVKLEKKFSHKLFETSDKKKSGNFGKKFIISSMIQGSIITGLTISLLINQIFVFNGNFQNMLEFSFLDNNGLFFYGFMLHIVLTVGLAVMGIFYNHIEANIGKEFSGKGKILPIIHLVGINIFGGMITLSIMIGGLATSDLYQLGTPHLLRFIPTLVYISAICFVSVLTVGIVGTSWNFIKSRNVL